MGAEKIKLSGLYVTDQRGIAKEPPSGPIDFASPPLPAGTTGTEIAIVRSKQREVRRVMGVNTIREIPKLEGDQLIASQIRAYEVIAGQYDLLDTGAARYVNEHGVIDRQDDLLDNDVVKKVNEFGKLADSVVHYATRDLPPSFAEYGASSVIKNTNNPAYLLKLAFADDQPPIERFRAKRKLQLMKLAANLDQQERKGESAKAYQQLREFFKDPVNPVLDPLKAGEDPKKYILSTHNPETFDTVNTQIITEEEKNSLVLKSGEKLTPIIHRTFTINTSEGEKRVNIYLPEDIEDLPRKKSLEAMIVKLVRKDRENPSSAIEDQVGFMAIFDTSADVRLFLDHLGDHADIRNYMLSEERVEDTLNGEKHLPSTPGSSQALRWRKSILAMDGMRPEFIAHTKDSFTDYRYKDGLSHREYGSDRLFRDGVIEWLFPGSLFDYDPVELQKYATDKIRTEVRKPE